jgi:hypothetical protein
MATIYPPPFSSTAELEKATKSISVNSESSPDLPALINQLIGLLPKKTPRFQRSKMEEFPQFLQEVVHIAASLEYDSEEQPEIISEIRQLMIQYYACVQSLKTLDEQFLTLTRNLYVNYAEPIMGNAFLFIYW